MYLNSTAEYSINGSHTWTIGISLVTLCCNSPAHKPKPAQTVIYAIYFQRNPCSIDVLMRLDLVQLHRAIICVNKWFLFVWIFCFFFAAVAIDSCWVFSSLLWFCLFWIWQLMLVSLLIIIFFYFSCRFYFASFYCAFCVARSHHLSFYFYVLSLCLIQRPIISSCSNNNQFTHVNV